jgi:hypothetical protein
VAPRKPFLVVNQTVILRGGGTVWPMIWDEFPIGGNWFVSGKKSIPTLLRDRLFYLGDRESQTRSPRTDQWQGYELLRRSILDQG